MHSYSSLFYRKKRKSADVPVGDRAPEFQPLKVEAGEVYDCFYKQDGLWYPARVDLVHVDYEATVTFVGYEASEIVPLSFLRPACAKTQTFLQQNEAQTLSQGQSSFENLKPGGEEVVDQAIPQAEGGKGDRNDDELSKIEDAGLLTVDVCGETAGNSLGRSAEGLVDKKTSITASKRAKATRGQNGDANPSFERKKPIHIFFSDAEEEGEEDLKPEGGDCKLVLEGESGEKEGKALPLVGAGDALDSQAYCKEGPIGEDTIFTARFSQTAKHIRFENADDEEEEDEVPKPINEIRLDMQSLEVYSAHCTGTLSFGDLAWVSSVVDKVMTQEDLIQPEGFELEDGLEAVCELEGNGSGTLDDEVKEAVRALLKPQEADEADSGIASIPSATSLVTGIIPKTEGTLTKAERTEKMEKKRKWGPAQTKSRIFEQDDDPNPFPNVSDKYWTQRFRLFSQFERGVKMDDEGWYSVTPERVSQHIAERCRSDVIVDCFVGCGGNAIQFALTCYYVIAIDIDPVKLECARHNARIYGVEDRIEFILGDCTKILPHLKADVVFLSPPWGGPDYLNQPYYTLNSIKCPIDGREVLDLALKVTSNVAYLLPRNTSLRHITEVAQGKRCEVEDQYLNHKLKTKTVYFGTFYKSSTYGKKQLMASRGRRKRKNR